MLKLLGAIELHLRYDKIMPIIPVKVAYVPLIFFVGVYVIYIFKCAYYFIPCLY